MEGLFMPWSASDADGHTKKADTPAKKKRWAETANAARAKAIKDGKSEKEADASAIRIANAAIGESVQETLQEYASSAGLTISVNRELGVISGVKILGLESKNKRSYLPECAARAMPLYENAAVFVDHQRKGESRSYRDRAGYLSGISAKPDGLYADLHLNPRHPIAEQLFWDAENAPANVGFSHNVEATTSRSRDGKTIVEAINAVHSVDLVAVPATTRGLFESEELPEDPDQRELCEHGLSAVSDARHILMGQDSVETKKARLSEVLATWQAELSGTTKKTEKPAMEWKDITKESLAENRKDLVEILTGTDETSKLTTEIKTLKESVAAKDAAIKEANDRLAAIEAERAKQAKTLAIAEELKSAKLDVSDKIAVSEAFMDSLNAAPDEAARKRLIEDRVAVTKSRQVVPGTPPFAPIGGDAGGPGNTKEETRARLR